MVRIFVRFKEADANGKIVNYWILSGRDWWNDPPHPRLQRVIDSLETISTQEYKSQ